MLFIHPMWDSESQRIGKQRCTPIGAALHAIADLLGFIGLLLFPLILGVWIWKGFKGTFHWSTLWLLAVPFGVGIVSEMMYQFSWWLALRKGWQYNDGREASWMENGTRVAFRYGSPPPGQQRPAGGTD